MAALQHLRIDYVTMVFIMRLLIRNGTIAGALGKGIPRGINPFPLAILRSKFIAKIAYALPLASSELVGHDAPRTT